MCFLAGYGPYLLWTLASGGAESHPIVILGFLALGRAPREYARRVGLFALSTAALLVVNVALLWTVAPIPLIGTFLVAFANNVLAIAQATLVEGFLRRHAELFGYD